jgi:hypothetical protein
MDLNNIISGNRTGGYKTTPEIRTDFQRDFDRIVCVGRSLGKLIGNKIIERQRVDAKNIEFYKL